MSGTLYCPSEITSEGGVPVCSTGWVAVTTTAPFDPSQLDPSIVAQAFGAGFSLPASFLIMAMGIRAFLNFIKQS